MTGQKLPLSSPLGCREWDLGFRCAQTTEKLFVAIADALSTAYTSLGKSCDRVDISVTRIYNNLLIPMQSVWTIIMAVAPAFHQMLTLVKVPRTQSTPTQHVRGFLALLPEIRNAIYEAAVAIHDGHKQPALSRACRQTRTEALQMFYQRNIFTFDAAIARQQFKRWADVIGKRELGLVRHLRFLINAEYGGGPGYTRWSMVIELNVTISEDAPHSITARYSNLNVSSRYRKRLRSHLQLVEKRDAGRVVSMLRRVVQAVPERVTLVR